MEANVFIIDGDICRIMLNEKIYTIIDVEDVEKCKKRKWILSSHGYAISSIWGKSSIYLHNFILRRKASIKIQMDHKNLKTLDNRKSNLRLCTPSQNKANSVKHKDNKSGYKGVAWEKWTKSWVAHIGINGKSINLGRFKEKIEAAKAYNQAAIKYFGEFARLNLVPNEMSS